MKASKKRKARLEARQTDYDNMVNSAPPSEQAAIKAAYHRPGSMKQ